ncbi:Phosphoglycerate mutase-like protein 1 [Bienertia sinuspersici]
MQTAVGVFGGGGNMDGIDVMVADAGNSSHPAISNLVCPPFLAVELCREHLGVHPCDKRRSKREYETLFPAIDFSLASNCSSFGLCYLPNISSFNSPPFELIKQQIENEDLLWKEDVREADKDVAERGMKFMKWLWTRSEKEIAIVSHSGFLFNMLSAFGNDCDPVVKNEICTHFANCELRSMVFVDKG